LIQPFPQMRRVAVGDAADDSGAIDQDEGGEGAYAMFLGDSGAVQGGGVIQVHLVGHEPGVFSSASLFMPRMTNGSFLKSSLTFALRMLR
jgi:hypothetical protein